MLYVLGVYYTDHFAVLRNENGLPTISAALRKPFEALAYMMTVKGDDEVDVIKRLLRGRSWRRHEYHYVACVHILPSAPHIASLFRTPSPFCVVRCCNRLSPPPPSFFPSDLPKGFNWAG